MAAVKLPSLFVLPLPASTAGLSELPSTVLPRVCSEAACWHFSQGSFKITRWILMSFLLWKVKGWEAWPFSTENPTWNSFLYPGWLRQKQKFSCLSLESLWLSFPQLFGLSYFASTLLCVCGKYLGAWLPPSVGKKWWRVRAHVPQTSRGFHVFLWGLGRGCRHMTHFGALPRLNVEINFFWLNTTMMPCV